MKKTILFLMLLALPLVTALEQDQVLTQAQVNRLDFDTEDLQPNYYLMEFEYTDMVFWFGTLSLERQDSNYKVVWDMEKVTIPYKDFLYCLRAEENCFKRYKRLLVFKGKEIIKEKREYLKEFQAPIFTTRININSFNITSGDFG